MESLLKPGASGLRSAARSTRQQQVSPSSPYVVVRRGRATCSSVMNYYSGGGSDSSSVIAKTPVAIIEKAEELMLPLPTCVESAADDPEVGDTTHGFFLEGDESTCIKLKSISCSLQPHALTRRIWCALLLCMQLHNPLIRAQRLSTSWFGVTVELEGVVIQNSEEEHTKAWLQVRRAQISLASCNPEWLFKFREPLL